MSEFTATFWGVRGGYPVPGKSTIEFGGNTTCLEVRVGPHLIIIDAGTGIIGLGKKLAAQQAQGHRPIVGTIFFTHGHHDHTQGFPFFAPFRFRDAIMHVFGPPAFGGDLGDLLQRSMLPSVFPVAQRSMPGLRSMQNVYGGQAVLIAQRGQCPAVAEMDSEEASVPPWAVRVAVYHSSFHGRGGSYCYRIEYGDKRLVFATDTEGYVGGDVLLGRFVQGADVLIHDGEYTEREYTGPPSRRQGWGHSTWRMAVTLAQRAEVKRLVLTHHNAKHDDAFVREMERKAQGEFSQTVMAREGMTIEL